MDKILKLARREYQTAVRTKGFLISLLLMPVIMGGSLIVMALLGDRVDTTDQTLVVVDRSGQVAEALAQAATHRNENELFDPGTGRKILPAYHVEIVAPDEEDPQGQRLALSERVRKGEIHAFVEIGPEVLDPAADPARAQINYHAENAAMDDLRRWLRGPLNHHLRSMRLEAAGLDPASIDRLLAWREVEGLGLLSRDPRTGEIQDARHSSEAQAILGPVILLMLMFMMVMMGAMPLLQSVMEEKTQRIAEVLLGSLQPFQFMMGKVLGGVAVSLTCGLVYVVGGVLMVRQAGLSDFVPYESLPWFFVYMLLAILMMGSMMASVGAACNDLKDAQNLTFPAMLPVLVPMFLLGPVLEAPQSGLATGLSLVPPFTPMLMLLRMSTPGGVPDWQPWVGLAGILLTTALAIWAGGRIFRIGILMQGKAPHLATLLRWAVRG